MSAYPFGKALLEQSYATLRCRCCLATDLRGRLDKHGRPLRWVEPGLCSGCVDVLYVPTTPASRVEHKSSAGDGGLRLAMWTLGLIGAIAVLGLLLFAHMSRGG